jgi:ABC-2 type transport system ATP-binding protein
VLSFEGVHKTFDGVQALAGCSFGAARGRMLGFLGPNGAGKTTAMRAIFGLVRPDAGEVLWDGRTIGAAQRMRFGYMPEERGLYPRMQLGEQLAYFGALHGMTDGEARAAAASWLARLGLTDRAGARVEELSHGNQQRAQLAAALVHEPELLVLDEPFAGLDPVAVQVLAELLRGEAERGAAVLFSSHQLELVQDICEEITIIDHGHIVATGDLAGLRGGSRHRRITLRLDEAAPGWRPGVPGIELVDRHDGVLRLRADCDVDPEQLLADARRTAHVLEFSYGPPTLAELFLELVE